MALELLSLVAEGAAQACIFGLPSVVGRASSIATAPVTLSLYAVKYVTSTAASTATAGLATAEKVLFRPAEQLYLANEQVTLSILRHCSAQDDSTTLVVSLQVNRQTLHQELIEAQNTAKDKDAEKEAAIQSFLSEQQKSSNLAADNEKLLQQLVSKVWLQADRSAHSPANSNSLMSKLSLSCHFMLGHCKLH